MRKKKKWRGLEDLEPIGDNTNEGGNSSAASAAANARNKMQFTPL